MLENNDNIRILSTLELEERFNTPSSRTLEYVAETSSGAVYRGFFTPVQIDHSPDQYFEIRVPIQSPLQSIQILRVSDGKELFRQDFGLLSQPLFQIEVNPINESRWVIPATNHGRRIIKRLQPEPKILVFDQDRQDAIIEGNVGELIEVQYFSLIGRIQKFRVTLR